MIRETTGRGESFVWQQVEVAPQEMVATALWKYWQKAFPQATPIIFLSSRYGTHRHHQAFFLDAMCARISGETYGLISQWEQIAPPFDLTGLAGVPLSGPLLQANAYDVAVPGDSETVIGPVEGWYKYTFRGGWTAFAVMLTPETDGDALSVVAIPEGHQDEWLAFLQALKVCASQRRFRDRRGVIDVIDGNGKKDYRKLVAKIQSTTFKDLILPETVFQDVQMHLSFFQPEILERYASRKLPRKRLVLVAGPPGTGKTTLLKAVAASHAQQGGSVMYLVTGQRRFGLWETFVEALQIAVESQLPTLLVIDDFENLLSEENMHDLLNVLDGINTPDNPAGTMILASTNAPQKIDPRIKDRAGRVDAILELGFIEQEDIALRFLQCFLADDYRDEHATVAKELCNQPGSHLQEVCARAALLALNAGRSILEEDLLHAHQTILQGREIASDEGRFVPPSTRRRVGFDRKRRPR